MLLLLYGRLYLVLSLQLKLEAVPEQEGKVEHSLHTVVTKRRASECNTISTFWSFGPPIPNISCLKRLPVGRDGDDSVTYKKYKT